MRIRKKTTRKRYMIRWLSSVVGSVSVTATCTLVTCSLILPRLLTSPWWQFQGLRQSQNVIQTPIERSGVARAISIVERKIADVPIRLVSIDLTDPQTFIGIGLANQANQANSARSTKGAEAFNSLVHRHRAAITISGTFFSMDAQKRVMGNMVSGGQFLKYSPWENYGTTLGIRGGNQVEMRTARVDGKPEWNRHWFSLTAGPRLVKSGEISINPKQEGFTDPDVMGVALRSAIGFPRRDKKLLLVTFHKPITLQKEAAIMRALGCYEAMNLDGGTSLALASGNRILHPAGRPLTNVITVYDKQFPAPENLKQSWYAFQRDEQVALTSNNKQ